jgi:hypothetical protein
VGGDFSKSGQELHKFRVVTAQLPVFVPDFSQYRRSSVPGNWASPLAGAPRPRDYCLPLSSYCSIFSSGALMNNILQAMAALTPQLENLESYLSGGDFAKKGVDDLLGENPQAAFSKIVEFKAALDRMRGLTWVYMEAAASAGRFSAERTPQPLKRFLREQAAKKSR